jgi:hypothetical protein
MNPHVLICQAGPVQQLAYKNSTYEMQIACKLLMLLCAVCAYDEERIEAHNNCFCAPCETGRCTTAHLM